MMGGRTPETCWAVNKRQDNRRENCCIWLVIYLDIYFSFIKLFPKFLPFCCSTATTVIRKLTLVPYTYTAVVLRRREPYLLNCRRKFKFYITHYRRQYSVRPSDGKDVKWLTVNKLQDKQQNCVCVPTWLFNSDAGVTWYRSTGFSAST